MRKCGGDGNKSGKMLAGLKIRDVESHLCILVVSALVREGWPIAETALDCLCASNQHPPGRVYCEQHVKGRITRANTSACLTPTGKANATSATTFLLGNALTTDPPRPYLESLSPKPLRPHLESIQPLTWDRSNHWVTATPLEITLPTGPLWPHLMSIAVRKNKSLYLIVELERMHRRCIGHYPETHAGKVAWRDSEKRPGFVTIVLGEELNANLAHVHLVPFRISAVVWKKIVIPIQQDAKRTESNNFGRNAQGKEVVYKFPGYEEGDNIAEEMNRKVISDLPKKYHENKYLRPSRYEYYKAKQKKTIYDVETVRFKTLSPKTKENPFYNRGSFVGSCLATFKSMASKVASDCCYTSSIHAGRDEGRGQPQASTPTSALACQATQQCRYKRRLRTRPDCCYTSSIHAGRDEGRGQPQASTPTSALACQATQQCRYKQLRRTVAIHHPYTLEETRGGDSLKPPRRHLRSPAKLRSRVGTNVDYELRRTVAIHHPYTLEEARGGDSLKPPRRHLRSPAKLRSRAGTNVDYELRRTVAIHHPYTLEETRGGDSLKPPRRHLRSPAKLRSRVGTNVDYELRRTVAIHHPYTLEEARGGDSLKPPRRHLRSPAKLRSRAGTNVDYELRRTVAIHHPYTLEEARGGDSLKPPRRHLRSPAKLRSRVGTNVDDELRRTGHQQVYTHTTLSAKATRARTWKEAYRLVGGVQVSEAEVGCFYEIEVPEHSLQYLLAWAVILQHTQKTMTVAGPQIFACGNCAGRCRWSAGFLGDLPFTPPFNSDAAPHTAQSPSSALKSSLLRVGTPRISKQPAGMRDSWCSISVTTSVRVESNRPCAAMDKNCNQCSVWSWRRPVAGRPTRIPDPSLVLPGATRKSRSLFPQRYKYSIGSAVPREPLLTTSYWNTPPPLHFFPTLPPAQGRKKSSAYFSVGRMLPPGAVVAMVSCALRPARQPGLGAKHPAWGCGGAVVGTLSSHLGESNSISGRVAPRFSHVAGFLRDFPFPPHLHFGAAPYSPSFTLIGCQDLDVKSRPRLFYRSLKHASLLSSRLVRTPAGRNSDGKRVSLASSATSHFRKLFPEDPPDHQQVSAWPLRQCRVLPDIINSAGMWRPVDDVHDTPSLPPPVAIACTGAPSQRVSGAGVPTHGQTRRGNHLFLRPPPLAASTRGQHAPL
ncbi:hypothetical protein PR048_009881 [Dryococelus australis]|uniref:Uncharacterized protein n=1 Tax=Dryococelus australis TaxID=614101 RepID=A0ABQ9I162_9NEOP|nr:hypothetical protein PR048_009881 [Dryococelus australis]